MGRLLAPAAANGRARRRAWANRVTGREGAGSRLASPQAVRSGPVPASASPGESAAGGQLGPRPLCHPTRAAGRARFLSAACPQRSLVSIPSPR